MKIIGENLQPVSVAQPSTAVCPAADGSILLLPGDAELHGTGIRVEAKHGHDYLAAWDRPEEWTSWGIQAPGKSAYEIDVVCSAAVREVEIRAELAGQELNDTVKKTTGWYDYQTLHLGKVALPAAGKFVLKLRAADAAKWKAVNIRSITMKPVGN